MNFLERALPLIQRGLFVIPVSAPIPGDRASGKNPLIPNWQNSGTINRNQIEAWHASWPNANTGVVANGVVMLDDDRGDLKERYEVETGRKFPAQTFTVITSTKPTGLRGYHYYFESTPETLILGNRKTRGYTTFSASADKSWGRIASIGQARCMSPSISRLRSCPCRKNFAHGSSALRTP